MSALKEPGFPRNKVMSRSQPDFVILSGLSHPDLVSSSFSHTALCQQLKLISRTFNRLRRLHRDLMSGLERQKFITLQIEKPL